MHAAQPLQQRAQHVAYLLLTQNPALAQPLRQGVVVELELSEDLRMVVLARPVVDGADKPVLKWLTTPEELSQEAGRIPVASVGASARFNLFGYMVLEMYYAYPFQRPQKGAHFGFQLLPGW